MTFQRPGSSLLGILCFRRYASCAVVVVEQVTVPTA